MSDEKSKALVPQGQGSPGWSGDDHLVRRDAAKEAGLVGSDAELDSYTEGFKQGMTLDDPADHAIVLRGRTVLREKQLGKSLKPMLRFLRLTSDTVALRVHDGSFELRVSGKAAEEAAPAMDSSKAALSVWIAAAVVGYGLGQLFAPLSAIIWGAGLLGGALILRQGLVNGRSLLAARLTVGLAMLAQEEQSVLPPSGDPNRG
jgi:hypothetical protein